MKFFTNIFEYPHCNDVFVQHQQNDWHLPSLAHEDTEEDHEADVMVAPPQLKKPPMYKVVMHNDDYTPMEFVVHVLQQMFGHSYEKAMEIMLNIHNNGVGVAGIYPRDIAETKAQMVNREARTAGHPLLTQIEPLSE